MTPLPNEARARVVRPTPLCLVALLTLASACGAAEKLRPQEPVVATQRTNIYSAIGGAEQIDSLHAGVVVKPLQVRGEWVRVGDGVTGWAKASRFIPLSEAALQRFDRLVAANLTDPEPVSARGMVRLRLKQHAAAEKDFERALRIDPGYAMAHKGRGDLLFETGEYDKAISAYSEALGDDERLYLALNNRGVAYERIGDLDQALVDYLSSVRVNPHYSKGRANASWIKHLQGDDQGALQLIEEALRIDPRQLAAYKNAGMIYDAHGMHREAVQNFNKYLRIDPNDFVVRTKRALSHIGMNKFREAIDDATFIIVREPANFEILYTTRGYAYFRSEQYKKALDDLLKAVEADPNNAQAQAVLGAVAVRLGKVEEGLERIDQAIEMSPEDSIAHQLRAEAQLLQGDKEQANRSYNEALKRDPNNPMLMTLQAGLLINQMRIDQALQLANRALQLDPQLALAHRTLGRGHSLAGLHTEAIRNYNAAIELDPEDPVALVYRADTWIVLGQLDRAVEDARQATQLDNKSADAYRCLGDAYRSKRRYNTALRYYERAEQINPHTAYLLPNRAALWGILGEEEKGVADLKAYAESPDSGSDGLLRLALGLRSFGDPAQAIDVLRSGMDTHEQIASTLMKEMMFAQLENGDPEAVIETYHSHRDLAEQEIACQFLYATASELTGDDETALGAYKKVVRREPTTHEAIHRVAEISLRRGADPDECLEWATRACRASEYRFPSYLETLAACHNARGDHAKAVRYMRQALSRLEVHSPIEKRKSYLERIRSYAAEGEQRAE